VDEQRIGDALRAVAAPFGGGGDDAPDLSYARLYTAVAGASDDDPYPMAIEFVYEGYLLHYRVSRVLGADATVQTRLLAGDQFDARGLRGVAAAGDLDSVMLLTRLMATCSWLRSEGLPPALDDDLWVLTVGGIASVATGGNAVAASRAFDEIGLAITRGRVERLPGIVRRGAAALYLREARPLRVALGLEPNAAEPDAAEPDAAEPDTAGPDDQTTAEEAP
jgi:hypothetical protein